MCAGGNIYHLTVIMIGEQKSKGSFVHDLNNQVAEIGVNSIRHHIKVLKTGYRSTVSLISFLFKWGVVGKYLQNRIDSMLARMTNLGCL